MRQISRWNLLSFHSFHQNIYVCHKMKDVTEKCLSRDGKWRGSRRICILISVNKSPKKNEQNRSKTMAEQEWVTDSDGCWFSFISQWIASFFLSFGYKGTKVMLHPLIKVIQLYVSFTISTWEWQKKKKNRVSDERKQADTHTHTRFWLAFAKNLGRTTKRMRIYLICSTIIR